MIKQIWSHPIVKGMIAIAGFVIVAEFLLSLVSPHAWAAMSIPITEHISIEFGDLPQWIIGIVSALTLWKAWKAEKAVQIVKHETNSMRAALELAAKAEGRLAGRQELHAEQAAGRITAKEAVRSDAIADAQSAADIKAIEHPSIENDPSASGETS